MCNDVTGHVYVELTGDRLPLVMSTRDSATVRGIARILILEAACWGDARLLLPEVVVPPWPAIPLLVVCVR